MIDARFEIDEDRRILTFREEGHAGFKDKGEDIVCASASMLAYTLAQNVRYEESAGSLKYKPVVKIGNGRAKISVRAKDDDSFIRLSHLYCVIQTGFQLLSHNYPTFIVVTMFGEGDNSL